MTRPKLAARRAPGGGEVKKLFEDWILVEIEAGRITRDALNEDGTVKAEWLEYELTPRPLPLIQEVEHAR